MVNDGKACGDFKRLYADPMKKILWNTVQFNPGWTPETMVVTTKVAQLCWSKSLDFAVEVKMTNKRRADLVIPAHNIVVEIQDSESDESIARKRADYELDGLTMVVVPANSDPLPILRRYI